MLTRINNRLHFSYVVWITFMWCMLMGEFNWTNIIGGLALGFLIVLALPLPKSPTGLLKISWGLLIKFIFIWLWDLIVASVKVAWLALRPQDPPRTAIIRIPMRVSSELVLYFATAAYNLQPGGSVSDIDIANRMWTVHLLDVDDEASLEREIQNIITLERRMIRIFEDVEH